MFFAAETEADSVEVGDGVRVELDVVDGPVGVGLSGGGFGSDVQATSPHAATAIAAYRNALMDES